MKNQSIKFISTDAISVDFFKGERKIAVFTDNDYQLIESIKGEYQVKIYNCECEIEQTGASLIIGIGGENALVRAKKQSFEEGVDIVMIPAYPTISSVIPYYLDQNCKARFCANNHTLLSVGSFINNQPREKLCYGLSAIACLSIGLIDEAFEHYLNENEGLAQEIIQKVSSVLADVERFSLPYATLGEDLMNVVYDLSCYAYGEHFNPLVSAYLFSLYNDKKMSYNDYVFATSFSIFAIYKSFKPTLELIMPPDRLKVIKRLKKILPTAGVTNSLNPNEFAITNYVLNNVYAEMMSGLNNFPSLARTYLRLMGNSGFYRRSLYTAKDLTAVLPETVELQEGRSLLKHIYGCGYLGLVA